MICGARIGNAVLDARIGVLIEVLSEFPSKVGLTMLFAFMIAVDAWWLTLAL